jgi:hypothetical protein
MVVAELLYGLGLSGSIVTIVVAAIALKHGRELFGLFSTLGLITRTVGLVAFVLVVLSTGLVPGVDLDVALDLSTLGSLLVELLDLVSGLVRTAL